MQPDEKISILVVDDDRQKLLTLETVLEELGQNVVCVTSGRDALRLLLSQSFAVILLDINMPGMDGFETASLIRQRRDCETTPIIFITAYSDELFVERGYSLGAVDYILAPIVPEVLRSKVSVFVELFRQTEQIRRQAQRLEQRTSQLSALANQLTDAEHRERRRLAHILHDHLQQLLVAAKMRITAAAPMAENLEVKAELENVHALLDQSIATSRSLTVELSPPVLHDGGLKKAIDWLARRFEKDHGLLVHVEASDNCPPLPEHLLSFLYQAVRELLFNIVKHAQVREAWLRLITEEDRLRIVVEDQGVGFHDNNSKAKPKQAVEHFGLFSIRERLLFLNGTFNVEAVEGRGTRITLIVPVEMTVAPQGEISLADAEAAMAISRTPRPKVEEVIRVLLVDDHEMLRKGLLNLLHAHAGIRVIGEAADGEQAVEMALRLQPDVIVMDLAMPRMNGIEATRRIVSAMPAVQVIGLSMHDASEMSRALCEAGAVSYLNKAGPPEHLIAAIHATRAQQAAQVEEFTPPPVEAKAARSA